MAQRPARSLAPGPATRVHGRSDPGSVAHAGTPTASISSRRGRPRLTPEDLRERLLAYSARYGVPLNDEGLPPFPAGQRETAQHREWMSLYKAHRRLHDRGPGGDNLERRRALLTTQRARCVVCRRPLDLEDARLDAHEPDPAVLHAGCLELVALARALGPEALDRVRSRL